MDTQLLPWQALVDVLRRRLMGVFDLEQFDIVRVCDCGSSATVFHCQLALHDGHRHSPSMADVAVKIYHDFTQLRGNAARIHTQQLVREEIRAMSALPLHANVIPLLRAIGPCPLPSCFHRLLPEAVRALQSRKVPTIALVTPFFPFTLEQLLSPGGASTALSLVELGKLVYDVMSAVYHCYCHGVLHLDLKEDNVMVTAEGRAVLIDFGSAVAFPRSKDGKSNVASGGASPGHSAKPSTEKTSFNFVLPVIPDRIPGGNPAHMHPKIMNQLVQISETCRASNVDFSEQPMWALRKFVRDVWETFSRNRSSVIPADSWREKVAVLAQPSPVRPSEADIGAPHDALRQIEQKSPQERVLPKPFRYFVESPEATGEMGRDYDFHAAWSAFSSNYSRWTQKLQRSPSPIPSAAVSVAFSEVRASMACSNNDVLQNLKLPATETGLSGFRNAAGHTMLHLAAMCAKDSGLRLAQSLIRHHLVDPTCVDKRQATALHYAAKENNAGVVTAIFEEIDKDHRNSASVGYAQNTRPSISELLPKSSPAACSALVWAVVFDSVDACRALLERLPYQIREDNAPCYETQPEYAATETDRRNENEFVSAQDDGVACINVFLYAIMRGSLRCAALLLEHGADINCRDSEGMTALLYAVAEGHAEAADLILTFSGQERARVDIVELTTGCTALFMACQVGRTVTRQRCGVMASLRSEELKVYLEQVGHPANVVDAVIERWMDSMETADGEICSHREHHGWSPLFVAVGCGHVAVVKKLCGAARDGGRNITSVVAEWLRGGTTQDHEFWNTSIPAGTTPMRLVEILRCRDADTAPESRGAAKYQPDNEEPQDVDPCASTEALLQIEGLLGMAAKAVETSAESAVDVAAV